MITLLRAGLVELWAKTAGKKTISGLLICVVAGLGAQLGLLSADDSREAFLVGLGLLGVGVWDADRRKRARKGGE